jgi:hypothetical protein
MRGRADGSPRTVRLTLWVPPPQWTVDGWARETAEWQGMFHGKHPLQFWLRTPVFASLTSESSLSLRKRERPKIPFA